MAGRYWDEVRDAANISASVLFDAATGFGGNGVGAAAGVSPTVLLLA